MKGQINAMKALTWIVFVALPWSLSAFVSIPKRSFTSIELGAEKPEYRAGAPRVSKRINEKDELLENKTHWNGADYTSKEKSLPDSISRRRLVFSLLASTATTSTLINKLEAQAVETLSTADEPTISFERPGFTGIIVPPMDTRSYESFALPNGLEVLLCSDPTSNTAAAAMNVNVGASSDPETVPGLAHFNEHMLFLGTEKYPQEDSFETFLSANGGSSNAFTDSEDTCYYFDMTADNDKRLEEGLDRFASFFTSPLFTEAATGRELNAIER